jgi:hypothetical protein
MPYGSIVFTLTNGRNLRDKDLFGRNDAYATVQLAAGLSASHRLILFSRCLRSPSLTRALQDLMSVAPGAAKLTTAAARRPFGTKSTTLISLKATTGCKFKCLMKTLRVMISSAASVSVSCTPLLPSNLSPHHTRSLCLRTMYFALDFQVIDGVGVLQDTAEAFLTMYRHPN